MVAQEHKPKKTYDAARTKEIILDAAEELFAEHGFSAARIDAIAKKAGYNKSLIYQYFQDKLGLYTEVVIRADQMGDQILINNIGGELMKDESITSDAAKFKNLLETLIHESFQFLLDYPRYLKILSWEAAEEWKTWNQITYRPDDTTPFYELAKAAQRNGIIRSDLDPFLFPMLLFYNVYSSIQLVSRFRQHKNGFESTEALEQLKDQVAKFVIYGVMEPSQL